MAISVRNASRPHEAESTASGQSPSEAKRFFRLSDSFGLLQNEVARIRLQGTALESEVSGIESGDEMLDRDTVEAVVCWQEFDRFAAIPHNLAGHV